MGAVRPVEPTRPASHGTVLVTGASGYIGGRLVPRLLEVGWGVRASFTDVAKARRMWWRDRVSAVEMDAHNSGQVRAAVRRVDAVVYLLHGMSGADFVEQDRHAAATMADAIEAEGVGRVVYVSGIVPPVPRDELSDHISSRLEVEEILSATSAVALTLRAAVVLGSGSTSFEIIRQISERLPVRTVPTWMDSRVQPIAIVDLLESVVGALSADLPTRHLDVGGPDVLRYPELLDLYARVARLRRPEVTVPLLPSTLVGRLAGAFTEVPAPTVEALVESLAHDMVCADDDFRRLLLPPGYPLLGAADAIRRSLEPEPHDDPARIDPMHALPHDPPWAGGGRYETLPARVVDAARSLLGRD